MAKNTIFLQLIFGKWRILCNLHNFLKNSHEAKNTVHFTDEKSKSVEKSVENVNNSSKTEADF